MNWIEYHLKLDILHNRPVEDLIKASEKFRLAKLSFLKAQIHLIMEQFQYPIPLKKEKIENEIELWKSKTQLEIIETIKQNLKLKKSA